MGTVSKPGFYNGRFHQGGQHTPDVDYASMSKDALIELAKDREVAHEANATKPQLIDALRAADAS